jgi:hypothetical protein
VFDSDSFYREAFSDLAWLFGDEPAGGGTSLDGGSGTFEDLMIVAGAHRKQGDSSAMDVCILAWGAGLIV